MRITFLLTQDLESPAGVGRYFPLASALTQLGHQVSIAALHSNFNSLSQVRFERSGVEVRYVAQMHVKKVGNLKLYYPIYQLMPLVVRSTWALVRAVLDTPVDVICVGKPHPMNSVAALLAKSFLKKPVVLDCDDYEGVNNRFGASWQKWVVSYFERLMVHHADGITTHTYVLRDYLLGLGVPSVRITYLPHGVDRARFKVDERRVVALRSKLGLEDRKVVIFVGSLSLVSHAVDTLLLAFKRVLEDVPNSVLLLIGGGEDFERLQRQAKDLGVDKDVRFYGKIKSALVPLYFRIADVSVDPVYDNEAGRASLSLKMFESWAAGVPLVTVDVGDRRRVVGTPPSALIVKPGNSEALAKGILQVLKDPSLAASLRARAYQHVEDFYWDRLVERAEEVCWKVVKARVG